MSRDVSSLIEPDSKGSKGVLPNAPRSHGGASDSGRIAELDGIRGIAIALVLLIHLGGFDPQGRAQVILVRSLQVGWAGVDLFFVLSGFLITSILIRSKDQYHYYGTFYVRRCLRIFPLYFAFLLVVAVVSIANRSFSREQLWYWVYMQNFRVGLGHRLPDMTHFWSLAIEEQFYFVWPFIVARCASRQLANVCCGLVASSFLLTLGLSSFQMPTADFIYMFTFCRVGALAIGGLVALIVADSEFTNWTKNLIACLTFLAGSVLLLLTVWRVRDTYFGNPEIERFGYLACDLMSGGLILGAVTWQGRQVAGVFRSGLLRAFGKYSYGIYVLHVPIGDHILPMIDRHFGHGLRAATVAVVLGTALSFAAATMSWVLVESRLASIKDRLTERMNQTVQLEDVRLPSADPAG